MLIGAADQVEQFLAHELIVAGEVGNHAHDGFGKIGGPVLALREEAGGAGNFLPCCQGIRLAVRDAGGQLGIERDHPAAAVGGGVGNCRPVGARGDARALGWRHPPRCCRRGGAALPGGSSRNWCPPTARRWGRRMTPPPRAMATPGHSPGRMATPAGGEAISATCSPACLACSMTGARPASLSTSSQLIGVPLSRPTADGDFHEPGHRIGVHSAFISLSVRGA